jgi:predicted aconitase with swiveling domain
MVNDGVVIFEPAITGVFFDKTAFDESVHRCVVNTRVTNSVHTMLRQVKGVYNGLTLDNGGASIDGVTDTVTGSVTGEVTPGKTVTITGKKIRVAAEEGETVESCITYTNIATQQVIVQEDAPVINDPSKIVLQLPLLPGGTYALTIKTLYTSASATLKAPRYITSKIKLVVKE